MELNQLIEKACADAVDFGKEFGVTLSFQPGDETLLEEQILPEVSGMFERGNVSEQGVWNLAVMFGIYLGELMRREYAEKYGFCWGTPDGNLPVLMKPGEATQLSPITMVHKRILNGPEDSVKSFYDVGRFVADGRFDAARKSGRLRPHTENEQQ